ncbi:ABC transporter permease [Arthrobacter rhombi]|uniref:ABC transporter permease n=1 Tax=Arthrobacter rhombi TaxID=71253 RepID=UPI0031CEE726
MSKEPSGGKPSLLQRMRQSNAVVSFLAVVLSLVVGGVLIAVTDEETGAAAGYFFSRPGDMLAAAWNAAGGAYAAMFRGAIFNYQATGFGEMFRPLTETFTMAAPLITASLGVALAFRAGLFNIGAQGQIIIGAGLAAYVGFAWDLPWPLHILLVVLASMIGGAFWGGLVGWIKAKTGAHEVILTIMLNYVAVYLLAYILSTPLMQRPGSSNPVSPIVHDSAKFPLIFGSDYRVHLGFLIGILATWGVWWLLERSTIGFELKAVGANPAAARTAGINTTRATVIAMVAAGALAGLAGASQVNGTEYFVTNGIAASIGFDAITVALLGRSNPLGVFGAALLFGAFRAGGVAMQSQTGTPIDIVLVVQSLIVLFIAAPPLVRTVFGLNARRKRTEAAVENPPTPENQPPSSSLTAGSSL